MFENFKNNKHFQNFFFEIKISYLALYLVSDENNYGKTKFMSFANGIVTIL